MKTKLLKLVLFSLTFGLFNQTPVIAAEATITGSLLEKIPSPYQVAQYGYHTANLAAWGLVLYVGYKAYTNENLANAVKTLYNLASSGDTVTPEERQAIKATKAKKHKNIQETAEAVQQHTLMLGTLSSRTLSIETTMKILQEASVGFAKKSDLEELKQHLDRRLDIIENQTRVQAFGEGVFKALNNPKK